MKPGDKVTYIGLERGGYLKGKEYTILSTYGSLTKVDSISLEGDYSIFPAPASLFRLVGEKPTQDYMELFT